MLNTLEKIRDQGIESFYSGEIANKIVKDMKANKGFLSLKDLEDYKTIRNEPLWGEYKDMKVATNKPPGGGIMVIQMLNILNNFDLRSMGHNTPEYIATVSEAMKYATIDKDSKVGDPDYLDVPITQLTLNLYPHNFSKL